MALTIGSVIGYSWEALGIVWLIGLFFRRPEVRTQPDGQRYFHLALALLGGLLLGGALFNYGWLAARILPGMLPVRLAGLVFVIAGCAFAIWARLTLGANWSGRASLQQGHALITTGPYALARHPIYTGLIFAVLGSALAAGQVRSLLGTLLILLSLALKMSQEEHLMHQAFPDTYPRYRRRVKALIPGLL